jgi:hypothetical protein
MLGKAYQPVFTIICIIVFGYIVWVNWILALVLAVVIAGFARILLDGAGPLPRRSDRSPRTRDWR